MFRNYFKTAFRNLLHNRAYAVINITGLAVGIAACLLVFLVVSFEMSFDNFHKNRDRIYRVVSNLKQSDGISHLPGAPLPVADALRREFPQLEKVGAVAGVSHMITVPAANPAKGTEKFNEQGKVFATEPSLFEILNFKWLAGNPATALSEINTAVLTKSTADKYFGDWKLAMGKTIRHDNRRVLTITGILDDIPINSDFPFRVVISYKTFLDGNPNRNDWESTGSRHYCFVVLPPGFGKDRIDRMLLELVKRHKPVYANEELWLQPFHEMHYDERYGNFTFHTFSREMITAMILIGAFLLIIAGVNFINLATAQAVNRSREVGVRKALGSNRRQLILQFLSETALITICALLLAVVLAATALPFVNQLLGVSLSFGIINKAAVVLFLAGVAITVTLLSGFYPAIVISGFNPVTALKSRITARMVGGISLRRGLVVFQFAVAQVLIIGMLVVVEQMDYFRRTPVGFDRASIVVVPVIGDSANINKMGYLRNRLLQVPGVKDLSFSFTPPAWGDSWSSDFRLDGALKPTQFSANLKWCDADYFRTYGLKVVAGSVYAPSDTVRGFVVNETLVKMLGFREPEAILGHKLDFWDGERVGPVVGVVKDFHSTDLRQPIQPVVMGSARDNYNYANLKIQPGQMTAALSEIEKIWKDIYPDYIYHHDFVDEALNNFYQNENRLSKLYRLFAGIAIFISCLGLYGLISYMAVQRSKEVGIRKVLGASVADIVLLLSKEFTLLIMIAFAIAVPVAWYLMHRWLENFAFHIDISIGIFLLTILGALCIAWITVGLRTVRAALANPVKAIKAD